MSMKVSGYPDTDLKNNTEGTQEGNMLMQRLFPAKYIKEPWKQLSGLDVVSGNDKRHNK